MQVVVDGTLTHYLEVNPQASKTLIILHGWANSAQNWLTVAQHLPTNYRYLLLDLPGFGQSQFLPNNPNVPQYTEFVVKFIHKLNLNQPILFGHSFGGQIAMDLSLKHPHQISHLILFAPAGIRLKTRRTKFRLRLFKIFKFTKKIIPYSLYKYVLIKLGSTDYANALDQHRSLLSQIVNYDLSTQLAQIKVPTTIIWGDQDRVIPYMGKMLAENIPDSKLTVLYGYDHIPHIVKPIEFALELNHCLTYE